MKMISNSSNSTNKSKEVSTDEISNICNRLKQQTISDLFYLLKECNFR